MESATILTPPSTGLSTADYLLTEPREPVADPLKGGPSYSIISEFM